jgi:hypothetical protein
MWLSGKVFWNVGTAGRVGKKSAQQSYIQDASVILPSSANIMPNEKSPFGA